MTAEEEDPSYATADASIIDRLLAQTQGMGILGDQSQVPAPGDMPMGSEPEHLWQRHPYYAPAPGVFPGWMSEYRQFQTEDEALAWLMDSMDQMTQQEAIQFQMALHQAGLYDLGNGQTTLDTQRPTDAFVPGMITEIDRAAATTLLMETIPYGGARSIQEVLSRLMQQNKARDIAGQQALTKGVRGEDQPITDPVGVAMNLQSYAQQRMGARLGYGQAEGIAARINAEERAHWARVNGSMLNAQLQDATAGTMLDPGYVEALMPKSITGGPDGTGMQYLRQMAGAFGAHIDSGIQPAGQRREGLSVKHELGLGAVIGGDPVALERIIDHANNQRGQGQLHDQVQVLDRDAEGRPLRIGVTVNEGAAMPYMGHINNNADPMRQFLEVLKPKSADAYDWVQTGNGGYGAYNIPKSVYDSIAVEMNLDPNNTSPSQQDRIGIAYAQRLYEQHGSMDQVARMILGGEALLARPDVPISYTEEGASQLRELDELRSLRERADTYLNQYMQTGSPVGFFEGARQIMAAGKEDRALARDARRRANEVDINAPGPAGVRRDANTAERDRLLSEAEGHTAVARRKRLELMDELKQGRSGNKIMERARRAASMAEQVLARAEHRAAVDDPDTRTTIADAVTAYGQAQRSPLDYIAEAESAMSQRAGAAASMGTMYERYDAHARAQAEFERTHGAEIQGRNFMRTWMDLEQRLAGPADIERNIRR